MRALLLAPSPFEAAPSAKKWGADPKKNQDRDHTQAAANTKWDVRNPLAHI